MLPRTRTLPKKTFEEVMKKGRSYHSPHFSLRLLADSTIEISRFSFAAPKKIEKLAVKRNSIRRRGLACVRHSLFSIPHGYLGIFFAKAGAYGLDTNNFKTEIDTLLKNIRPKSSSGHKN